MALAHSYRLTWLRLAAAFCALSPHLWAGLALAQTEAPMVEYERAISGRVNQTGQPLTLPVPLRDGRRELGEILIRVQPDDSVLVPKAALLEKLGTVLEPATLARLKDLPDLDGRIAIEAVRQIGLNLTFNTAQLELVFEPKVDQRTTGDLSVGGLRGSYQSADVVDPAKLSGYLNIIGGVDKIWQTKPGQDAPTSSHVDLQGVVQLRGVVAETDATFDGAVDTNRCNIGSLCTYEHTPASSVAVRA